MTIQLILILALFGGSILAEYAEKRSRKYYTDQALLRISGLCMGAALALGLSLLLA